jgi:hypothetical protein
MPNGLCHGRIERVMLDVAPKPMPRRFVPTCAAAPCGQFPEAVMMGTRSENGRVGTELSLALGTLCNGYSSAVRVACVPNGLEYRFFVCIEAPCRAEVYTCLALRTKVRIPPDGGPLNLSREEAVRVVQLIAQRRHDEESDIAHRAHRSHRQSNRMIGDPALGGTLQS